MFKRIIAIMALGIAIAANGQVKAPDFAYPKTVKTDAEKALSSAGSDGIKQLEALMQLTKAEHLIDATSLQPSFKRIMQYGQQQSDTQIKALFDLYAASVVYDFWSINRWKYNRRNIPLSPRPADMAEWSGQMFRNVIDSLCITGYNASGDMPIARFRPVVDADEIQQQYFPSLRDFAMGQVYDLHSRHSEINKLISQTRNFHKPGTAPWFAWTIADNSISQDTKSLLKIYNDAENKRAALIIWPNLLDKIVAGDSILVNREFCNTFNEAATISTNTAFNSCFKAFVAKASAANIDLKLHSFYAPNTDFKFSLSDIRNLSDVTITFKGFKTEQALNKYLSKKSGKPIYTKEFSYHLGEASPVSSHKEVSASLPQGFYTVSVSAPNKKLSSNRNVQFISVVPALPVVFFNNDSAIVGVYNTANGNPIAGATVSLIGQKQSVLGKKKSNASGLAIFKKPKGYSSVQITANNITVDFSNRISANTSYVPHVLHTSITTQRGLYHPGDTIRFLAVAMNDTVVRKGLEMNVKLMDTDGKTVATYSGISDNYGRLAGSFALPTELSRSGNFSITAYVEDNLPLPGDGRVMVSDYKLSGLQMSDITATVNAPQEPSVNVSGCVSTFSGQPVSNSNVTITVSMEPDSVCSAQVLTDSNGEFKTTIPYPQKEYKSSYLRIKAQVIGPDGEAIERQTSLQASFPYNLNVKIEEYADICEPLSVSYQLANAATDSLTTALRWSLKSANDTEVASGTLNASPASIQLPNVKAGQYSLVFTPCDSTLANKTSQYLTLYNSKTTEIPDTTQLFFSPNPQSITPQNGKISLKIGVTDSINIYTATDSNNTIKLTPHSLKPGYNTISVNVANTSVLQLFAVKGGKIKQQSFSILHSPKSDLNITLESFRDKVTSGTREHWKLIVTDSDNKPVDAAIVANIHDFRLDLLRAPKALSIRRTTQPNTMYYSGPGAFNFYAEYYDSFAHSQPFQITPPQWKYLIRPRFNSLPVVRIRGTQPVAYGKMYVSNRAMDAVTAEAAVEESREDLDTDQSTPVNTLRIGDVVDALWAPTLSTTNGAADISFLVPNANSTWAANFTVWTKDLRKESISRKFVSQKPIMVSINSPRFVRIGDRASIIATYMNTTDSTITVNASLACPGDSIAHNLVIAPHATETLTISLCSNSLATEMAVTARGSYGAFADGERHIIPVLPSTAEVTDATNFYVNPGDTLYNIALPQPKGHDFSLELTYTENPMWTVVEALPSLMDKGIASTANAQAAAYFSASVALGLMDQHPELGYKFNRNDLRSAMRDAEANLVNLQDSDGSFKWGAWSRKGDVHTTASVLDILATLKRAGYLDSKSKIAKLIPDAVKFYDENVRNVNLMYAIVRPSFNEVTQSLNGQSVTHKTTQWINKNWKKLDIGTKAQAASAMHFNGNENMARRIMSSVDQFGTQTADKGYEFKNVSSLQTYAWLLEAYAEIDKKSSHIDGIRQYLIVHKQATNWGNSLITSWIVDAMINSGTPWVNPAEGTTISVDSTTMHFSPTERMGAIKTTISGKELTLKMSGKTPSYGAVTARYIQPVASVKAFSDGEVSVDKLLLVLDQKTNKWQHVTNNTLLLGDRVKVILTVKTSRPMSQVVVDDARAAALEPVIQLPRFVFADGASAYLQNRDTKTVLYFDYLPKGTYLFEYEANVNNTGTYSSGIATATCTLAPTLTAHSSGNTLTINRADNN